MVNKNIDGKPVALRLLATVGPDTNSPEDRRAAEIKKAEDSVGEAHALQEQIQTITTFADGRSKDSILLYVIERLSKELNQHLTTIEHALMDLGRIDEV
jgi:hypothetical protein